MNLKIFALLGILSCAVYCPVFAASDTDDVTEQEYDDETDEEYWEDEEEFDEEEADVPVATGKRVVERVTCANIDERIAELREDVKSYPERAPELEKLLKQQRNQCSQKANRRPVRNYDNVGVVMASMDIPQEVLEVETLSEETEAQEEKPKKTKKKSSKKKKVDDSVVPDAIEPEIDLVAEREANLAAGLCADGAKPNKFGCCAGERFKETSQMKFECCPTDGDAQCHAPLKK